MNQTVKNLIDGFDISGYLEYSLQKCHVSHEWARACCIFHDDSTPSMSISTRHGGWKCFSCAKSGDLISLIQKNESLDFKGALNFLKEHQI